MSPRKQEQKVPTEDELKEFELRKREATQYQIPPEAYAQSEMRPPPMASRSGGPAPSYGRSPLTMVAVVVFILLFVALGALLYWVWWR